MGKLQVVIVFVKTVLCRSIILFPKVRLESEDYGYHLMGVEDLLQKHSLLEADVNVVGERVENVNGQAHRFIEDDFSEIGGEFLLLTVC